MMKRKEGKKTKLKLESAKSVSPPSKLVTREIGVDTAAKGQAQVEVEPSGRGATARDSWERTGSRGPLQTQA